MNAATRTVDARKLTRLLRREYSFPETALQYKSAHQLLVATILSAQCTDERVNQVTPGLFRKYRSVRAFAEAEHRELARDIFSTGFHNNKARAIIASARELIERHNGRMPRSLGELVKLTGVGRKTASVVLGAAFGIAEGIVVDTHVARLSRLLGLTMNKQPDKIEQDLMKVVPRRDWIDFSHLLIFHGRAVCVARRPRCAECVLAAHCPSAKI